MDTREASPSHFLVNIESFSSLDNRPIQTTEFVSGDYKWRLKIHPYGDDTVKDRDHISVYLAMVETSTLPPNWEVNATFSLFLFNQISGNYLYSPGTTRCFRSIKSEWGISKFISYTNLSDPSNGYLINDKCVFGAEVFIVQGQATIEYLSMKNYNNVCKRDFKIPKISKIKGCWYSEEFDAGGHKWKIQVYPKGDLQASDRYVSIYLVYVGSERVQAFYTVGMKSQVSDEVVQDTAAHFRYSSSSKSWGWSKFMTLDNFNDPTKGFLVKDCCHLEVEITVKAVTRVSSLSVE